MTEIAEISNCKATVSLLWPNAQCEVIYAAGGILVELVDNSFIPDTHAKNQKRLVEAQIEFNSKHEEPERFIIHRALFYEHPNSRYCVPAMLHTRRAEYIDGIFTSYLDAGDAKVWMRELDSEALQFGIITPRKISLLDGASGKAFRINSFTKYKEIAFEGRYFSIENVCFINDSIWSCTVTD